MPRKYFRRYLPSAAQAFLGYFAVQLGWRAYVIHAWRARARKREGR